MAGGSGLLDAPAQGPSERPKIKVQPRPRAPEQPAPEPAPEEPAVEQDLGDMMAKAKAAENVQVEGDYVRRGPPPDLGEAPWPGGGAGPVDESQTIKVGDVSNLSEALHVWPQGRDPSSGMMMKVWRKEPKKVGYQTAEGWLGDHPLMDETEFMRFFGGGKYMVQIWGPNARAAPDPGTGQPRPFRFAEFNVTMPGTPNYLPQIQPMQPPFFGGQFPQYPYAQQQPQQQQPMYGQRPAGYGGYDQGGGMGGGMGVGPVREILSFARDMAERDTSPQHGGQPNELLTQFFQMSREQAAQTLQMQASQLESERQRARALEDRLLSMSQQRPEADIYNKVLETQSLQAQIDRLREEHDAKVSRLTREHQQEMAAKEAIHQQTLQIERGASDRREESLRNEWRMREEMLIQSYDRKLTEAREDRNRELDSARKDHERAVESLRSDHQRAVDSMRSDAARDKEMQKALAETTLATYRAEVERLRADAARLMTENDNLKRQVFRPPQEAIKDAVALARGVGYVHNSEVPEPEERPSRLDNFLENVAPKIAPQVIGVLGGLAQQAMAPKAPAQAQATAPQPGPQVTQVQQPARRTQGQPRGMARFQQPIVSLGDEEEVAVSYDRMMPVPGPGETVYVPRPVQATPPQPPVDQPPPPPAPAPPHNVQAQPEQPQQPPQQAPRIQIRTRGPQPLPPDQLNPLIAQFLQAAHASAEQGASPEEFAAMFSSFPGLPDGFAKALTGWIDPDNAALLAEAMTGPEGGWDTAAKKRWMTECWAEIERLGNGK